MQANLPAPEELLVPKLPDGARGAFVHGEPAFASWRSGGGSLLSLHCIGQLTALCQVLIIEGQERLQLQAIEGAEGNG